MNADANRDAGFALLVVLAFLVLAASIATPFLTSTRTYAFATRNVAKAAIGGEQLRGAIAIAATGYAARALDGTDLPKQVTCAMSQPGITIAFDFQNHAGLVDLNAASAEALKTGFLALGVSGEIATSPGLQASFKMVLSEA
jgi:general secretion pathway protein K